MKTQENHHHHTNNHAHTPTTHHTDAHHTDQHPHPHHPHLLLFLLMVGRSGSVAECARGELDIFSHLCFSSFLRVNRGNRGFDARWRLHGRRAVTSSCCHLHHEDCLLLECGIHVEHVDSSGPLHLCAQPLEYVAPCSGRGWQVSSPRAELGWCRRFWQTLNVVRRASSLAHALESPRQAHHHQSTKAQGQQHPSWSPLGNHVDGWTRWRSRHVLNTVGCRP